ncbi:MAG: transcriptional regulator [Phycisphaerales bacterium]|nr:MAG: transcriptional regulator [Phycisphaerales bacterium]
MTDREFQDKLTQLMDQIEQAPESERARLRDLAAETRDRHTRMRRIIGELQESLDYLRLSVKYLVFDLEATRRENQYLRRMLDTQNNRGADDRSE